MNRRVPRAYPVCEVLTVHDGDTVRVRADVGFDFIARKWIRLKDVRAPELREPDGIAARNDVVLWLNEYAPDGFVEVTTFWSQGSLKEISEQQTFVRYVGVIRAPNGAELNEYLRAKGFVDRGQ